MTVMQAREPWKPVQAGLFDMPYALSCQLLQVTVFAHNNLHCACAVHLSGAYLMQDMQDVHRSHKCNLFMDKKVPSCLC